MPTDRWRLSAAWRPPVWRGGASVHPHLRVVGWCVPGRGEGACRGRHSRGLGRSAHLHRVRAGSFCLKSWKHRLRAFAAVRRRQLVCRPCSDWQARSLAPRGASGCGTAVLRRGRAWAKQAAWLSLLSPRWTVPFTWCSGHRRSLGPSVQGPPGADRAPSRTASLSMAPHVAPPRHLLQCRPLCLDWTDNVHTFFQNRVLPPPQYLISCSLSRGCDRTSLGTRPGGGGGSRWVSALRAPPGHPGPFSQGTCSWDGSPVAGAWNSGCWARWPLWPPGHLVGIPAVRPLSPSPRVKASPCSGSLPEARCPSHDPLAAICVLELGPDARWLARESGHRWARPGRVSEARRGERAHRGGFRVV